MRHIKIAGKKPDDVWLAKASALLDELRAAPDRAARNDIIDTKAALWGDLKDWLLALSHQKCWFSEAQDCFSHWHVEHFRPKKSAKDADGTEHDGYWWLAFDWTNFRICGSVGNAKKGTSFPLRPASFRTLPFGDTRLEDHQLLDPIDEDDPGLLSFDVEGNAIVAPGITDDWDVSRVNYSIEKMKLNFGPLVGKRRVLWAECWARINDYLNELNIYHNDKTNAVAHRGSKLAAKRLRELVQDDRELSSVARACIFASADPRVQGLLRT